MDNFRTFFESKGIRLDDDMHAAIMKATHQIAAAAQRVKQTGEPEDLPVIPYRRKYELTGGGTPRRAGVTVHVLNDPDARYEGQYEWGTVRFNVAHAQPDQLTDDWVYHILVHELGVHGVDPRLNRDELTERLPEKPVLPPNATAEDKDAFWSKYAQQPHEFDAFSGEIVNYILRVVPTRFPPPQATAMLDELMTWMKRPTPQTPAILSVQKRWSKVYDIARKWPADLYRRFASRVANAALEAKAKLSRAGAPSA